MKRTNKEVVEAMSVVEMRKAAIKLNIKNVNKFRRAQLTVMVIEAMDAKESKVVKSSKRSKAVKVEDAEVQYLANELLKGISDIDGNELMHANRKVLIEVMKMLHCSKWYRTYDKATMIQKIGEKVG